MGTNDTSDITTEQVDEGDNKVPNPTGKGGFKDHPENRNPGGWRKEVSFSYQYKRFMAMSVDELEAYAKTPKDKRTVVEDLAYARVLAARKSLPDVKEMTDRTEGRAPQSITITSDPLDKILNKFGIGEGEDAGKAEGTETGTSEERT